MAIPDGLLYSNNHEWVKFSENGAALVGLTDFAQESMGEIVFINLCMEGDAVKTGDSLGDVESIAAVFEIISPLTGVVAKINNNAIEKPELINQDPYAAWLIELEGATGVNNLMSAGEYAELISIQ